MLVEMPLAPSLRRAGQYPCLVLNASYEPLSAYPLSVWPWENAIHAVISDRVDVVAEHDKVIHSPSTAMKLPSVVALREYVPMKRTPAFTRHNVILRDRSCCAYCGHKFLPHQLTFDHVVPRAQRGHTRWTNIVSACHECNGKKGARTPSEAGMTLQWRPWCPTNEELARASGRIPDEHLHNGWREFLYWMDDLV